MSLHTWNKSISNLMVFDCCLQSLTSEDALLLLEDAAYSLLEPAFFDRISASVMNAGNVYVLAADLAARGISDRIPGSVKVIQYTDFVAMCLSHDKVINWN